MEVSKASIVYGYNVDDILPHSINISVQEWPKEISDIVFVNNQPMISLSKKYECDIMEFNIEWNYNFNATFKIINEISFSE